MSVMTTEIQSDQITSAFVNQINNHRYISFKDAISGVEETLGKRLTDQEIRMMDSITSLDMVREFVGKPGNILGSAGTKHGEIAEHVEVGIRNAWDTLNGNDPIATFENVGRTAADDYRISGVLYQSKYINGPNNTLDHIIDHMKKYDNFRLDDNTKYHIPKDQYEIIKTILHGTNTEAYNKRTIDAIQNKISEIEEMTGEKFFSKIESAHSTYAEVQINKVGETLDMHETGLVSENERIKESFNEKARENVKQFEYIKEPTLGEALKSGVIGAGVSASMKLGFAVYIKCKKEEKRIYEYDINDWKEIGIDVGKGAVKGGISGSAIYGLTNFSMMPAPVAGGYVSAVFSVGKLVNLYKNRQMDFEDLLFETEVVCVEAGLAVTCALVGQALIPVPVLGAVTGSIIGSMVAGPIMKRVSGKLGDQEQRLLKEHFGRLDNHSKALELEDKIFYEKIIEKYTNLSEIESYIFDDEINSSLRFLKSGEYAVLVGVKEKNILRSISDVDALFG